MEQEITKIVFNKIEKISKEELYEANKGYNASSWREILNRFDKYKNTQFYIVRKENGNGYEYDRYFATYEVPEGIIFFNTVSYTSSLSSNGFVRIGISMDGVVRRFLLNGSNGKYGKLENCKTNRLIMAKESQSMQFIWSNNF